jgi:hypothetical protein
MTTQAIPAGNGPLSFYVTEEEHHPEGGSTLLGFWIYLMSDCLIFASLFACYGVLGHSYAGGPSAREALELPLVAVNTAMLLFSSITYGFAMLAMERGSRNQTLLWLAVTWLFGAAFIGIEMHEFAGLIAGGIACMLIQFYVSIRDREKLKDVTGDPWNARSLEWSTSSPPPPYNFAFTPIVHDMDAWWDMKTRGGERPTQGYHAIHMPKNSATGVVLGALATAFGFAMIWYMWWLAAVSFVAAIAYAIFHTFNYDRDYHIPADEVARIEDARTHRLATQG